MPGPVVSLCHGSPMHAWLVTGFMKESSRLDLHASKYRIEQQNFRSFVRSFVRLHPCLTRGGKERLGRGGENMDHLRGNVFADCREISKDLNNSFRLQNSRSQTLASLREYTNI